MASTRERNGKWTGLYRNQDGKQQSAGTFKTHTAALKAANACEALEKNGQDAKAVMRKPVAVARTEKGGKVTVAGYFPKWLSGHKLEETSRNSYECMGKHIIKGLGNVALHELTADKVRTFFRDLEKTDLSGSTIGHVMTVLREMCKTAVIDEIMTRNPTEGIKIANRHNAEMKILTPAQYKVLMTVIPSYYAIIVRTLVSTGLRWGECMGLQKQDITARGTGYVIKVNRVVIEVNGKCSLRDYGKTENATREISIDKALGDALLANASKDGFIFRARRGGWLTRTNFRRIWTKALADAGIAGVRVHDMRHTHASWLVNNGADLVTVRDRLGHSDIKVTSRYLHVVPGSRDVALEALGKALTAAA